MGKLYGNQKTILRKASREAVQKDFRHLARHFKNNRWIGNTNRYRRNCIGALKQDLKSGAVNNAHLAQYIAASAPLHCLDGWSFLGRAIDSHTRGDYSAACHLGYYAELRAAISLLAVEGIGIFSDQHFVLESSSRCQKLPGEPSTHRITWLALEHWANLNRSADLLADIISPHGISIRDWLDAFVAGANLRPIGSRWLKTWGLDLNRLSNDREARNEASYRPNRLNFEASLDVLTSSRFLRNLWAVYEPSVPERFENLDRHLLRLSIEQAYEAVTGTKAKDNTGKFEGRIDEMLRKIALDDSLAKEWKDFLLRKLEPNTPTLISEAGKTAPTSDAHYQVHIMARAALLLRVATGACGRLLQEAGFTRADLEFWWKPLGTDRGLWEPGDEPSDFIDLWANVEDAIEETGNWEATTESTRASFARWREERSIAISVLGECERIALWGLGL